MCGPVRQIEAGQFQEIIEIAGPADGDGDTGDAVFKNQIPSGDPGEKFAQGGVGIGIGRTGHGNHGGKFGIAQGRKDTGQAGEDEGEDDAGAGSGPACVSDDRRPDQHKDAGSDDRADAQRRKIPGAQRSFEAILRVVGVGQNALDRFGAEQSAGHGVCDRRGSHRVGRRGIHMARSIAAGMKKAV